MDKLILLANQLSRHNIFAPSKKNNWYWKQQPLQQNIIISTCTILHLRLDVITIRYAQEIPNNICNRIQAKKPIQRSTIIMTDADYDYTLDEIERGEKSSLKGT